VSYRISGLYRLDEWLATDPPPDIRRRVLVWLMDLLENPDSAEVTPIPGMGLPVYTAVVPGTDVPVSYVLMKHTVYDDPQIILVRVGS
jgi:hypothetical protein